MLLIMVNIIQNPGSIPSQMTMNPIGTASQPAVNSVFTSNQPLTMNSVPSQQVRMNPAFTQQTYVDPTANQQISMNPSTSSQPANINASQQFGANSTVSQSTTFTTMSVNRPVISSTNYHTVPTVNLASVSATPPLQLSVPIANQPTQPYGLATQNPPVNAGPNYVTVGSPFYAPECGDFFRAFHANSQNPAAQPNGNVNLANVATANGQRPDGNGYDENHTCKLCPHNCGCPTRRDQTPQPPPFPPLPNLGVPTPIIRNALPVPNFNVPPPPLINTPFVGPPIQNYNLNDPGVQAIFQAINQQTQNLNKPVDQAMIKEWDRANREARRNDTQPANLDTGINVDVVYNTCRYRNHTINAGQVPLQQPNAGQMPSQQLNFNALSPASQFQTPMPNVQQTQVPTNQPHQANQANQQVNYVVDPMQGIVNISNVMAKNNVLNGLVQNIKLFSGEGANEMSFKEWAGKFQIKMDQAKIFGGEAVTILENQLTGKAAEAFTFFENAFRHSENPYGNIIEMMKQCFIETQQSSYDTMTYIREHKPEWPAVRIATYVLELITNIRKAMPDVIDYAEHNKILIEIFTANCHPTFTTDINMLVRLYPDNFSKIWMETAKLEQTYLKRLPKSEQDKYNTKDYTKKKPSAMKFTAIEARSETTKSIEKSEPSTPSTPSRRFNRPFNQARTVQKTNYSPRFFVRRNTVNQCEEANQANLEPLDDDEFDELRESEEYEPEENEEMPRRVEICVIDTAYGEEHALEIYACWHCNGDHFQRDCPELAKEAKNDKSLPPKPYDWSKIKNKPQASPYRKGYFQPNNNNNRPQFKSGPDLNRQLLQPNSTTFQQLANRVAQLEQERKSKLVDNAVKPRQATIAAITAPEKPKASQQEATIPENSQNCIYNYELYHFGMHYEDDAEETIEFDPELNAIDILEEDKHNEYIEITNPEEVHIAHLAKESNMSDEEKATARKQLDDIMLKLDKEANGAFSIVREDVPGRREKDITHIRKFFSRDRTTHCSMMIDVGDGIKTQPMGAFKDDGAGKPVVARTTLERMLNNGMNIRVKKSDVPYFTVIGGSKMPIKYKALLEIRIGSRTEWAWFYIVDECPYGLLIAWNIILAMGIRSYPDLNAISCGTAFVATFPAEMQYKIQKAVRATKMEVCEKLELKERQVDLEAELQLNKKLASLEVSDHKDSR